MTLISHVKIKQIIDNNATYMVSFKCFCVSRMDLAVEERKQQSGFMPPGRPKKWRNKCFEILEDCISNK